MNETVCVRNKNNKLQNWWYRWRWWTRRVRGEGLNRTMDAILTIPCACSRKSFDFHLIQPSAGLSRRQFSLFFFYFSFLSPSPHFFFIILFPSSFCWYSFYSSPRVCIHFVSWWKNPPLTSLMWNQEPAIELGRFLVCRPDWDLSKCFRDLLGFLRYSNEDSWDFPGLSRTRLGLADSSWILQDSLRFLSGPRWRNPPKTRQL